jgi:hypothetical protein
MPKVRKRTSKRVGLRLKFNVQKKASESRKKIKKEARKIKKAGIKKVRSKHGKTTIPNDYPYKPELMDEIERQEQEMEERKQQMRSLKIANKHLPGKGMHDLPMEVDAPVEKRELVQTGLTAEEVKQAELLH